MGGELVLLAVRRQHERRAKGDLCGHTLIVVRKVAVVG